MNDGSIKIALKRIEEAKKNQSEALDLSSVNLIELPESIGQLINLQELNLGENPLKELPDSIGQLVNLRNLYLMGNQLTELPQSIGQLTNLQELNLGANPLKELPESIGQLTNLQNLYSSGNQLTKLPESIGQLKNLLELNLNGNPLNELPKSIGQLISLQVLYLDQTSIKELPESIGQLKNLRNLNLDENQLKELPQSIGQLTNLQILFLMRNQLTGLPESINKLINLREVYLDENPLEDLPESIGLLKNLETFSLTGIEFRKLPEVIFQLVNLHTLYIDKLHLEELSESLGKLTNLRTLYLQGNHLTKLPKSIGKLTNLNILHLTENQLTELPESMIDLKDLRQLFLHGNKQLGLPTELLGSTHDIYIQQQSSNTNPHETIDFYFRVRENGRPLNEAKLILVGRGAVGKTSLVNRLIHDKFNPSEGKTDGIKIDEWKINLGKNEEVRLNVWDFGGQEIMHATHQFFLTERSLYLLVLNGREGAEDIDAEYWLKLIDSFGGKSPVIVVLNKISDHPFDLNRHGLLQKYPNIKDFIRTDCGEEIGIDDLRWVIKRETNRLDDLRVGFPSEWFDVKDKLAESKKNFLSFDQFRGICKRNKVGRRNHQETLAKYLNQLGIVLNYKDDPRLRDTHVLNPRWVTEGIYKILNSEILERNNGELRLDEISRILPIEEYPIYMCRFIFDLMKKFYLCFSFPDDECHYLIPELLGKEEPRETEDFKPEKCLSFQYHYSILPEGILPRFIVRTNILSEGLPRWRSGVILKFEGCRALIKADIVDKKVSILVTGNNRESRRRLLAVIRSDFDRIHHEIRNLEVQEMVPLPAYPEKIVSYDDLLVRERAGTLEYSDVVNNQLMNINVKDLLNGVDLERVSRRELSTRVKDDSVRLFYSYSHIDERLRNQLEIHLKILQRRNLISTWNDRQIGAGEDWKKKIDDNLESANIILLLISANFIASDYCYEKEMNRAIERHKRGEAVVIPIILRDTNWKGAPFADLLALPKDAKAVTTWGNRDSAWRNVSEGIERVVGEIRSIKEVH